ncbi:S1C family serine protease [Atopobacter phocae]|uniref:S1C family serine protease n=1 Tax=Atopobacter phocae TaxID=136492 RepID=UPI00046F3547|nr:trypsin-like peptidase domain-containing protein [Atopobacter phocae]
MKNSSALKSFIAGIIGGMVVLVIGIAMFYSTGYLTKDAVQQLQGNTATTKTGEIVTESNKSKQQTAETMVYEKDKDAIVSVINLQDKTSFLFGSQLPSNDQETNRDNLVTRSEGSGVIYKKEGNKAFIVTNNHVIDGGQAINILLSDGEQVEAKVVGADPWTDLAVLEISSEKVKAVAEFANSDEIKVGQKAIAIGSPLGIEYATSVTSGIVSGVSREVAIDIDGDNIADFTNEAIQTDAAINPGNSGGALLNDAGQVIGINSMKIGSSLVEGMGFAIPSNQVVKIAKELEEKGQIIRPKLGIEMYNVADIPDVIRAELKIPDEVKAGIMVTRVAKNSNAEKAGLKMYDILTSFDGKKISNTLELRQALYQTKIGDTVKLEVLRNGKQRAYELHLDDALDGEGLSRQ